MQDKNEEKENTKFYNFKKGDLEISKGKKIIFIIFIILLMAGALYYGYNYYKTNHSSDNTSEITDTNENSINLDDYTITGTGISISDNAITINKEGTYTLSRTTTNSNIIVDTNGKVTLILHNAN